MKSPREARLGLGRCLAARKGQSGRRSASLWCFLAVRSVGAGVQSNPREKEKARAGEGEGKGEKREKQRRVGGVVLGNQVRGCVCVCEQQQASEASLSSTSAGLRLMN